jgi:two-component system, chemotaxis family, chemotaxis protein CheY
VELRISAQVFTAYALCLTEIYFMEQMKVLIIDDNEKVRLLLRDYLPTSVDEIYECADGGEAFALYQKHRPDWVLMDWEMPNVNGITAIRRIIAEFPKAHICMVTAFDDEAIRAEALSAGARRFVLKDNLFELEAILVDELEN